jgi:hypothetical protein
VKLDLCCYRSRRASRPHGHVTGLLTTMDGQPSKEGDDKDVNSIPLTAPRIGSPTGKLYGAIDSTSGPFAQGAGPLDVDAEAQVLSEVTVSPKACDRALSSLFPCSLKARLDRTSPLSSMADPSSIPILPIGERSYLGLTIGCS